MLPLPKLLFCNVPCGSINPTPISCSGCGNENPRSTNALTRVNCVVTPQMPSASTNTARKQNDFSLNRTRKPMRTSCRNDSIIDAVEGLKVEKVRGWRLKNPDFLCFNFHACCRAVAKRVPTQSQDT